MWSVICPRCYSERSRRSKRRSLRDYVIGLTGLRPWRCGSCGLRFFAGNVALAFALTAHCRLCGNFAIQQISRKYVGGWTAWLFRLAHAPAYRCPPCRHHFFSMLPRRDIHPIETGPEPPVEPKAGSPAAPN
jgi:hypothetical protein